MSLSPTKKTKSVHEILNTDISLSLPQLCGRNFIYLKMVMQGSLRQLPTSGANFVLGNAHFCLIFRFASSPKSQGDGFYYSSMRCTQYLLSKLALTPIPTGVCRPVNLRLLLPGLPSVPWYFKWRLLNTTLPLLYFSRDELLEWRLDRLKGLLGLPVTR